MEAPSSSAHHTSPKPVISISGLTRFVALEQRVCPGTSLNIVAILPLRPFSQLYMNDTINQLYDEQ